MSSQHSATVCVGNGMGGTASIWLFHHNEYTGTQRGHWSVEAGKKTGPLTVYFEKGWIEGSRDYWSILVHVVDGPNAGFYGNETGSPGFECNLQDSDTGQEITLAVAPLRFSIALPSGACFDGMSKLTPETKITHVFVVMLENHSFDHLFAMSGIAGITAATTSNSNSYAGETYHVQPSTNLSLVSDPGHEFADVVEQLAGEGKTYRPHGPYPPIDNSGFAANYATSRTEGDPPPFESVEEIMGCFATPVQLPVLYRLATEFALCDHWYSSLPGPTWPNRFFMHGASSSGLDDSPTKEDYFRWGKFGGGFAYAHGTIYQALAKTGNRYRFYHDTSDFGHSLYSDDPLSGSVAGSVPQAGSLKGVSVAEDFYSLERFGSDLQGAYPWPYTFIEPHYGDVAGNTYVGGSSQHPMDDVFGGEALLANVYNAIRASPYWETSLVIVTYDEHGGLYDSVAPPDAIPPGDPPTGNYSTHGFTFDKYGVRVPAVIVSPLIPKGTVDKTVYDHSSVLKTVETLWKLRPLTKRDAAANDLCGLLSLAEPRADCPEHIPPPMRPFIKRPARTAAEQALRDSEPLPEKGNLIGTLAVALKTDNELSAATRTDGAAKVAAVEAMRTRGEARIYIESVMKKVRNARRRRDRPRRPAP